MATSTEDFQQIASSAESDRSLEGFRNILYVLHHDFTANSAAQVHALANHLIQLGHCCAVAVPQNKATVSSLGSPRFVPLDFSELEEIPGCFRNGRPPDIVHAWTPRESVRVFAEAVRARYPSCHLFVHLEDNEWHILERFTGRSLRSLKQLSTEELDRVVPPHCSHPERAVFFMGQATGITVIIDRLRELAPESVPTIELWPSAPEDLFFPRPRRPEDRRHLGIPRSNTVLVYTGNIHAANAQEMRSLYLAVAILNREGHPTTLVRAGRDFCRFLGPDESWARAHSVELGQVHHRDIPALLALADVLVQPGRPDPFNDYRFPSKIPEFLSVGRPVILPRANVGLHMRHGEDAWLLDDANGLAVADAVRRIMEDPPLYDRLAEGGMRFFRERLSWAKSAQKLSSFYGHQLSS